MVSQLQMFSLGILWVGGWSFVMFEYPQKVCTVLRAKNPSEHKLRLFRRMGAIGLIWVAASCLLTFVFGFFR
jgi:hypothetical protein